MSTSKGIEFYGGYQVYSDTGVDLTLLRENLRRGLEERWERNRQVLAFLDAVRPSRPMNSPSLDQGGPPVFDPTALVTLLAREPVEFVLIGGLAMKLHGSVHVTEDLDVCYGRSPANISALATALASIHPYLRGAPPGLPFRFDAATIQAGLNFTLRTDLGDVDFLGEVSGVGKYEQALARSDDMELYGLKIRVLSLDGLIAAKKAAGRVKDRNHLLELEELKKLRDAAKPQGET
jgi:hypothetical protein